MIETSEEEINSTEKIKIQNFQKVMTKKRIIKNIAIICLGTLIFFTAYDGPTMLQSTMNKEQNIGVISQAIGYICFSVSAIFLPKYIIKKFGSKTTFVVSVISYIPYIAENYYPHWIVMIPASILIGVGASTLWGSQASYLNDISVMYADSISTENNHIDSLDINKQSKLFDVCSSSATLRLNFIDKRQKETNHLNTAVEGFTVNSFNNENSSKGNENIRETTEIDFTTRKRKIESITGKVFGVYGMAYLSSHMWGNLMSYYILKSKRDRNESLRNSSCVCGANYCNSESECFDKLEEMPDETRYIFTTVCVSLAVVSVLVVALFLDPLEVETTKEPFSCRLLMATLSLAKRKELLLLSPLSFCIGQVQGFYSGEFTKAYIGCSLGMYNVSLVSVCYGGFCAFSATLSGWFVKSLGRKLVFSIAALLNLTSNVILLLWNPDPNHVTLFFIVAAFWGTYVGTIWSQLRAFYGILFKADEDAAFATFNLWYSLGFSLSLAYAGFFCTYIKIYVLLAISTFGYVGYLIVEISSNESVLK